MRNTFPVSLLRGRLPVVIGDDLRLLLPGGRAVQLTPRDARALGCRLIRQAAVADPDLMETKRTPATPKRAKRGTR